VLLQKDMGCLVIGVLVTDWCHNFCSIICVKCLSLFILTGICTFKTDSNEIPVADVTILTSRIQRRNKSVYTCMKPFEVFGVGGSLSQL